jgi:6-phospho-beta-glucosidase
MPVKIAIIGGSAFSTPSLINFLKQEKFPGRLDVVLASRSQRKLDAVTNAAKLLATSNIVIKGIEIRSDTWERVLVGADCILIQIRVGGYEGRRFDETFPHKYGLCGDEGLGVGGLSAGWRTWPILSEILDAIAKFSPHAFVVLLTSPLGLLMRASLAHTNLKVVGICELPWTTLLKVRSLLEKQIHDVQADYFGINHLGWLFNIRSWSEDSISVLATRIGENSFPSGAFLRAHHCLPIRYLRLHYEQAKVLTEQMSQEVPRSEALSNLQELAYGAYARGELTEVMSILERRATPWYSHAVGPLLIAMTGQPTDMPFFLSTPHGFYTPFLEPDDVVETAHRWMGGQLERSPLTGTVPEHVVEQLLPLIRFERTATEAVMSRKPSLLVEALSLHPWVHNDIDLKSLANEIVVQNGALVSH